MTKPHSSCPDLESYLNREGSDEYREQVQVHLEQCHNCREEVEMEIRLQSLLNAANNRIDIPSNLIHDAQVRVQNRATSSADGSRKRREIGLVIALAMILLFLVGVFGLLRRDFNLPKKQRSDELATKEPMSVPQLPPSSSRITVDDNWIAARLPHSDENIEIYIVLPTQKNNTNNSLLQTGAFQ